MEMVAASKMRRTQETMKKSLPYADKIRGVIGHIFKANPDYKHPFLVERKATSAGYIVVSSDKGLCGGLNVNMFRPFIAHLKEQKNNNIKTKKFSLKKWKKKHKKGGKKGHGYKKVVVKPIVKDPSCAYNPVSGTIKYFDAKKGNWRSQNYKAT